MDFEDEKLQVPLPASRYRFDFKVLPPAILDDVKDFTSCSSTCSDSGGGGDQMLLQSMENLLQESDDDDVKQERQGDRENNRRMKLFKDRLGLKLDIENDDDDSGIVPATPPRRRRVFNIASPPAVTPSPTPSAIPAAPGGGHVDYYNMLERVFKDLHTARSQAEAVSRERDLLFEQNKSLSERVVLLEKSAQEKSVSMTEQIREAIQEQIQASIAPLLEIKKQCDEEDDEGVVVDLSAVEAQVDSLRSEVNVNFGEMKHRMEFMDSRFESLMQLSSMVQSKVADLELLLVQASSSLFSRVQNHYQQHHHHHQQQPQQQHQAANQANHYDEDWEIVSNSSASPSRMGSGVAGEEEKRHQHQNSSMINNISSVSKKLRESFEKLTPGKDLLGSVPDIERTHAELLDQLESLGYKSRGLNAMLLKLHNYDIELVKKELSALHFQVSQ
eukprot:TRINITY_DN2148_c0_g1_i1.p1 TRINITY_DN2148_c0_g1~~TRINITY_DN2148_c0_g1_i1.p1  ORF type:complete len:445 (-),score=140.46 TRINITY_DN2148_c0_g1_i1:91-1425(-)